MTAGIAQTYAARGVVVVGVGADGWSGLGESARHAIRGAGTIIGSPRQLEALPVWVGGRREEWRSPRREDIRALIEEYADTGVAVLASGDPLVHGIGRTLVEELGIERLLFLPNLSSVALACARLGWPAEDVTVLNAPGGGLDALPGLLADGARLIVLSAGRDTPATLAVRLTDQGYGGSELVVLGDLGSAREQRWGGTARDWAADITAGLNLVAVTCRADGDAGAEPGRIAPSGSAGSAHRSGSAAPSRACEPPAPAADPPPPAPAADPPPRAPAADPPPPAPAATPDPAASPRGGDPPPTAPRAPAYALSRLADSGPLLPGLATGEGLAQAVAAAAILAALEPAAGDVCWEIGGTGAGAVAYAAAAPGSRGVVIGADPATAPRATPFGMAPLQHVTGALPAAAAGLPTPDAALLTGPGITPRAVETAWRALRLGGRLVGAAVTLEEAAALTRYQRRLGGDLTRLQLTPARAQGADTRYGAPTEVVLWVRHKSASGLGPPTGRG